MHQFFLWGAKYMFPTDQNLRLVVRDHAITLYRFHESRRHSDDYASIAQLSSDGAGTRKRRGPRRKAAVRVHLGHSQYAIGLAARACLVGRFSRFYSTRRPRTPAGSLWLTTPAQLWTSPKPEQEAKMMSTKQLPITMVGTSLGQHCIIMCPTTPFFGP